MSGSTRGYGDVHVTHEFMGRLGNAVLQMYRAFWFAAVHGIPDSGVVFRKYGDLDGHALCSGVSGRFLDPDEYGSIKFNKHYSCFAKTPARMRTELAAMDIVDGDGVCMDNGYFLYPELPWERSLFIRLFGNIPYRDCVAMKYAAVLRGNTVGYTVRRTDMVGLYKFRTLSESRLLEDLSAIVRRHFGMVRVLVASDDPDFVERVLASDDFVRQRVYAVRADVDETLYLLSLCDYVFSNGQCQCSSGWVNDPETVYESTFGQIAQILNRSYKYASFACTPSQEERALLCGGVTSYVPLMYP